MKDVIKLVETKNIGLTYYGRNKNGEIRTEISLFHMEVYGYCIHQKNVADEEYKNVNDAVKRFYELIERWKRKNKIV